MSKSTLSPEVVPTCWSDDVRMNALFATFRPKTLNPVDWEFKMKFWSEMIAKRCQFENRPFFNIEESKIAFRRGDKLPACLETVVEHLSETGAVVKKEEILNHRQVGWIRWGVQKLVSPMSRLTSSVLSSIVPSKSIPLKSTDFVHLNSLDNLCTKFLSSIPPDKRIGSLTELRSSSDIKQEIDDDVLNLIICRLVAKKIATCCDNGKIFKLSRNEKETVSSLTESEICLLQLEVMKVKMEAAISTTEKDIIEAKISAKNSLSQQSRTMAMHHLRKKKVLENRLVKLSKNLESLIHLSDTISQTHNDAEIMEAYKYGLRTLKNNMKQTGLEENNVFDTMDDMKEIMQEYKNIEFAISQPVDDTLDMDELEAELSNLFISSDNTNDDGNNASTLSNELDDVPSHSDKEALKAEEWKKPINKTNISEKVPVKEF